MGKIRLHAGYIHRSMGCPQPRIVRLQQPVIVKGKAVRLRLVAPGIVIGLDERHLACVFRANKKVV